MKQIEVAKKYVGQKEISGNMGFVSSDFERKMEAVGWQDGHAWCAYAMELVFKEAYPERFKEFDRLFSASAVQTFKNFKKAGYNISEKPVTGALVIWQRQKNGVPHWTGHAGLVGEKIVDNWIFDCYEGNSNTGGSRNGDQFVYNPARKHIKEVYNGLKIMGFVVL